MSGNQRSYKSVRPNPYSDDIRSTSPVFTSSDRADPAPRPNSPFARARIRGVGYGPPGMAEAVKIVVLEGDQTGQELLEQSLRLLDPGLLGIDLSLERSTFRSSSGARHHYRKSDQRLQLFRRFEQRCRLEHQ